MPNISFVGVKKRKTRHSGYIFRMTRQEPSHTQLARAPQGLLSLVDELLLNIIDHIDNQQAFCSLAATCMRFQDLVEPYVWRDLLVLNGNHARRIASALDMRDARIDYVKSLAIRYKDDHKEGIEELNHFIALMGRLKHLQIESPCPNNSEWRAGVFFDGWSRIDFTNLLASAVYPRRGIPLALPMLQSLTLHAHGPEDRKFLLGRAKAMFLHPTLRKITMSCLDFETDLNLADDIVAKIQKSTPLQSLVLIECNVNVRFLDVVLSLPKALQELSIGERLHTFTGCEPTRDWRARTSAALFLTALQRQAGSLQRLVHIGGAVQYLTARETDPHGAARLRSFTSLQYLELGLESHLYYYLRQNQFPPALRTLKMLDAALSINAGNDIRAMSGVAFRSITTLVSDYMSLAAVQPDFTLQLHFSDHLIFHIASAAEQNRLLSTLFLDRPAIYKIATMLKSYNAHFLVSRDTFPSGTSYIPPYMYGEELPVDDVMYDSSDYWRFNGIDYRYTDDESLLDQMETNKLGQCEECKRRMRSVADCRILAGETACLPCARHYVPCRWKEQPGKAKIAKPVVEEEEEYEEYIAG
ncbi:hypothetical protein CC86DRAFT_313826 [Ophiobolus disseminans]|uniref:F-box domain-containing protein n=1 Tax=Ophiobolus disseminans TaxID=1469910 RepID=A0A6A7AHQ7_9PLEO|nr:hypothetical protein CC86DRAFT_313826 [Ophiobolus disseminans]